MSHNVPHHISTFTAPTPDPYLARGPTSQSDKPHKNPNESDSMRDVDKGKRTIPIPEKMPIIDLLTGWSVYSSRVPWGKGKAVIWN